MSKLQPPAQVDITNIPASTAAANAFADTTLTNTVVQASQGYTLASGGSFSVTADAAGAAAGAAGNSYNIQLIDGANNVALVGNTLQVTTGLATATAATIAGLINGHADFNAVETNAGAAVVGDAGVKAALVGGRDAGSGTIRVTADTAGVDTHTVTIQEVGSGPAVSAAFDGSDNIVVSINGTTTYAAIAAAIDGLAGYSAAVTASSGDQTYDSTLDTPPAFATLGSGAAAAGGITQDAVFELAGKNGREVFSFQAGSTITQIQTAINSLSDSTGVSATVNGTTLELNSTEYGSKALVEVALISEGAGGTINAAIGNLTRTVGTDVVATINGIQATGNGNALTLNTATLDLGLEIQAATTGISSFTIAGGGALFQLGPKIVTNQQARLGIGSVSTARLGGTSGRLYELKTGEAKSLANNPNAAASIVDEVITDVVELRGRLGAFQRTTLQSNIASLSDTLVNLTAAESSIRDADFAKESAALTRAQILVQSGTSVLAIANQNPQNVLSLLR